MELRGQEAEGLVQALLASRTGMPETGAVGLIIIFAFIINLCNDAGCSSSNPQIIIIQSDNEPNDINHGFGSIDWGNQFFSPFVDVTSWPPFSFIEMIQATNIKYYNLGFIVARGNDDCEATWGGYYTLDGWSFTGDFMFPLIENNEIGYLRELGGDIMISIGGASNIPLASATDDIVELKAQYQNIIETFRIFWGLAAKKAKEKCY